MICANRPPLQCRFISRPQDHRCCRLCPAVCATALGWSTRTAVSRRRQRLRPDPTSPPRRGIHGRLDCGKRSFSVRDGCHSGHCGRSLSSTHATTSSTAGRWSWRSAATARLVRRAQTRQLPWPACRSASLMSVHGLRSVRFEARVDEQRPVLAVADGGPDQPSALGRPQGDGALGGLYTSIGVWSASRRNSVVSASVAGPPFLPVNLRVRS